MPVIVLTNEEVRELLPIGTYVDAIESAYREYGLGRAVIQTRTDLYGESPAENQYCCCCVFKSMVKLPRREGRGFLIMSHLDYSRQHRSPGLSLALQHPRPRGVSDQASSSDPLRRQR